MLSLQDCLLCLFAFHRNVFNFFWLLTFRKYKWIQYYKILSICAFLLYNPNFYLVLVFQLSHTWQFLEWFIFNDSIIIVIDKNKVYSINLLINLGKLQYVAVLHKLRFSITIYLFSSVFKLLYFGFWNPLVILLSSITFEFLVLAYVILASIFFALFWFYNHSLFFGQYLKYIQFYGWMKQFSSLKKLPYSIT
jgi:hypothetical protein